MISQIELKNVGKFMLVLESALKVLHVSVACGSEPGLAAPASLSETLVIQEKRLLLRKLPGSL